jgi:hypothetical protein
MNEKDERQIRKLALDCAFRFLEMSPAERGELWANDDQEGEPNWKERLDRIIGIAEEITPMLTNYLSKKLSP